MIGKIISFARTSGRLPFIRLTSAQPSNLLLGFRQLRPAPNEAWPRARFSLSAGCPNVLTCSLQERIFPIQKHHLDCKLELQEI